MNQNPATRTTTWEIRSVFVPKRDGHHRVEMAIRFLLGPPPPSDPPHADGRHDHESRNLRPRRDRQAGA
jgi:hypothetical protein